MFILQYKMIAGGEKMGCKLSQNIINKLIERYEDGISTKELSDEYNISTQTVINYLRQYNVFKPKTHNWTKEMNEKLKAVYPSGDWDLILQLFPGRSRNMIYTQASKLGLHNESYFWSEHDKNILKEYYNIVPTEEIQNMLDRPYKIRTIQNQAKKLGLTKSPYWTDEEVRIMNEKYSYLGAMGIMEFLPNKTYHAIIGKAVAMGLRCEWFYTEEEVLFISDNYLIMSDEEMGLHLNRDARSIMEKRHNLGLYYPVLDRKYYDMVDYIRHNNVDWKRRSMMQYNYKCIFTNDSNFEIHHLYSFNLILKEAMQDNRWIDKDIKDYDETELKFMLNIFNEYQDKYPLGVCISPDIHKLFHSIYGNRYNTVEQWNEFKQNYKNEFYKHQ